MLGMILIDVRGPIVLLKTHGSLVQEAQRCSFRYVRHELRAWLQTVFLAFCLEFTLDLSLRTLCIACNTIDGTRQTLLQRSQCHNSLRMCGNVCTVDGSHNGHHWVPSCQSNKIVSIYELRIASHYCRFGRILIIVEIVSSVSEARA
jgi:hypothetical protein